MGTACYHRTSKESPPLNVGVVSVGTPTYICIFRNMLFTGFWVCYRSNWLNQVLKQSHNLEYINIPYICISTRCLLSLVRVEGGGSNRKFRWEMFFDIWWDPAVRWGLSINVAVLSQKATPRVRQTQNKQEKYIKRKRRLTFMSKRCWCIF